MLVCVCVCVCVLQVFSSAPDVSAVAFVESIVSNETLPFEVPGTWEVYDINNGWSPADTASVQCICESKTQSVQLQILVWQIIC